MCTTPEPWHASIETIAANILSDFRIAAGKRQSTNKCEMCAQSYSETLTDLTQETDDLVRNRKLTKVFSIDAATAEHYIMRQLSQKGR